MKFTLKYLLIIALTTFLGLQSNAQTIKGHIFDGQTRQPLVGVYVATADSLADTVSGKSGYFEIETKTDKGELHLSLVGYQDKSIGFDSTHSDLKVFITPITIPLNTVVVKSFNAFKKIKETPAAVAVLKKQKLEKGSSKSIQAALNSVAGIRMDQTGVAEGRLSIRGMGARAPWGIRKVRVYLNGIPLTGANGITSWDDVNVNSLGRVEIIKGPSSSIYGSGTTGGVLNFYMKRANYGERSLSVSGLVGSYGLHRIVSTFKSGSKTMSSFVSYGYQEIGGYRDHSNDIQRFVDGHFGFYPSDKQTISLLVHHASQFSQLPGTLTKAQVEENRRQASAISQEKDTRRYTTRTRLGINQKYDFNDKLSNSTSFYTYFMDFREPLSYGVPTNFTESMGGRTYFTYKPGFTSFKTKFIIGAEVDQDRIKSILYANENGETGMIYSNLDYKNTLYTFFYQSETRLFPKATLTLGLSYSGLNYNVTNYLNSANTGIKRFGPRFSPRAALSYDFGDALSLHGSVSTGYNPPNTDEIQNIDNTINQGIEAEKAINYEIDAKGGFFGKRLSYNLALFRMQMRGELIGQSPIQGVTIFRNSGRTMHEGVELAANYKIIDENGHGTINKLNVYTALTYSHFRFEDFKTLDAQGQVIADYDGNAIPGIGPWMVYFGLQMNTKWGLYFSGNFRFNDRYALNDANTDYNPAYHVVNGKIGYKTKLWKRFDLNIYAGLNNITDSHYSSFTAINAVGYGGSSPAYFEPAPGINGYGGLNISYDF